MPSDRHSRVVPTRGSRRGTFEPATYIRAGQVRSSRPGPFEPARSVRAGQVRSSRPGPFEPATYIRAGQVRSSRPRTFEPATYIRAGHVHSRCTRLDSTWPALSDVPGSIHGPAQDLVADDSQAERVGHVHSSRPRDLEVYSARFDVAGSIRRGRSEMPTGDRHEPTVDLPAYWWSLQRRVLIFVPIGGVFTAGPCRSGRSVGYGHAEGRPMWAALGSLPLGLNRPGFRGGS